MRRKHYYKLINECSVTEPTGVKHWREMFPSICVDWRSTFVNIYRISKDNKLRQFQFLHKVITTKKERKKFNIATDDECTLCSNADSIFHTFMECNVSSSIYSSILKWFNDIHSLNLNLTNEQITFNLMEEIEQLTPIQKRRLDLLLLLVKHCVYTCKVFSKDPNFFELTSSQA